MRAKCLISMGNYENSTDFVTDSGESQLRQDLHEIRLPDKYAYSPYVTCIISYYIYSIWRSVN